MIYYSYTLSVSKNYFELESNKRTEDKEGGTEGRPSADTTKDTNLAVSSVLRGHFLFMIEELHVRIMSTV